MTTKIKVGDVVVRVRPPKHSCHWLRGLDVGETGVVEDIAYGGYYRINGWLHTPETIALFEEVQEGLPPVPDSVLYFNSETYGDRENDQRLLIGVGTDFTHSGNIFVGCKPRTDCDLANFRHAKHGVGINLDPDSALQLAHDLTRMALKLKREQEKD